MTAGAKGQSYPLRGWTVAAAAARYPAADARAARALLVAEHAADDARVIVLDDDPTGVQTVHGIPVYTGFEPADIEQAFDQSGRMFFVLTNSRSLSRAKTQALHAQLARGIAAAARARNQRVLLISRSDSTLRGHYPLETDTLRHTIEAVSGQAVDGEILCPFFYEGGRLTLDGVHYVVEQERLVPAGETEFARDRTFGYQHADLAAWIEEKSDGATRAETVARLPLALLRQRDMDGLVAILSRVRDFGKIVVDALIEADIEVAAAAILRARRAGKTFLLRTAAAMPRALGGVMPRGLLTRAELAVDQATTGGLFVVGSHVARTTAQWEHLVAHTDLISYEFAVAAVRDGTADATASRLAAAVSEHLAAGRSVVVHTTRRLLTAGAPEADLALSVQVSRALVRMVSALTVRPRFLVAKGGITASDIGVQALGVRRALVLGQVLPGVPVWQLGPESRFPGMPYVIFPGNVGAKDALWTLYRERLVPLPGGC